MMCPVCEHELRAAHRMGVQIEFCTRCGGIWLERGALERIIERSVLAMEQATPTNVHRQQ